MTHVDVVKHLCSSGNIAQKNQMIKFPATEGLHGLVKTLAEGWLLHQQRRNAWTLKEWLLHQQGRNEWTLSFKSTARIYEHENICLKKYVCKTSKNHL